MNNYNEGMLDICYDVDRITRNFHSYQILERKKEKRRINKLLFENESKLEVIYDFKGYSVLKFKKFTKTIEKSSNYCIITYWNNGRILKEINIPSGVITYHLYHKEQFYQDWKKYIIHRNEEGFLHKKDGPAIIYPNKTTEYWVNGNFKGIYIANGGSRDTIRDIPKKVLKEQGFAI